MSSSQADVGSPSSGSMSVRDVLEGLVDIQRPGVGTRAVITLCSSNQGTTSKRLLNALESLGSLIASGGFT